MIQPPESKQLSIAQRALHGAIWLSLLSYCSFIVNFLVQIVIVRYITPTDQGMFAFGVAAFEISTLVLGLSVALATVQLRDAPALWDTALWLTLGLGAINMLVCGIIAIFFGDSFGPIVSTILIGLAACQTMNNAASIYAATLEKEIVFKWNSIARGMASNGSAIAGLLLAMAGFGVWSLLMREIISMSALLIAMRAISPMRAAWVFNPNTAKALIKYTFKIAVSRSMETLQNRLPYLLIGTTGGKSALGLFSQAIYLAGLPNRLMAGLNENIPFSVYSKIRDNSGQTSRFFNLINYWLIRLVAPIAAYFFLDAHDFVLLLFGEKWLGVAEFLPPLATFVVCYTLFWHMKSMLYAMDRVGVVMRTHAVGLGVLLISMLAASFYSAPVFCAWGFSLAILTELLLGLFVVKRIGISVDIRNNLVIPAALISSLTLLLDAAKFHLALQQLPLVLTVFVKIASLYAMSFALFITLQPKVFLENVKVVAERLDMARISAIFANLRKLLLGGNKSKSDD